VSFWLFTATLGKGLGTNTCSGLLPRGVELDLDEMHKNLKPTFSAKNRYSARNMAKPITFFCAAPQAKSVALIGDFNDWDPTSHPMIRQPDGSWQLVVPLNHGHHHYLFLVDEKPILDPRASGVTRNEKNERVSLMAIS